MRRASSEFKFEDRELVGVPTCSNDTLHMISATISILVDADFVSVMGSHGIQS